MATAAEILGPTHTRRVQARWAKAYERLGAQRDRLMARDCASGETSSAKDDDLTDAACEESERGLCLLAAGATQHTLFEVLAAIHRIECGTYGICEITGDPIEAERLKAIPWARYSLQGQRELEQGGCAPKRALPSLRSLSEPSLVGEERDEAEG